MDHNRCHLVGRLARDPQYIPKGRKGAAHCIFTIAINRVVPMEEGPVADFIQCSLWGEEALRFVEIRAKGDEVGVLGRIRTGFIQQADGGRKFFSEVRVEEVQYGRRSLKNLQPKPREDHTTRAVGRLAMEFKENEGG